MLHAFLLPETEVAETGAGTALDLGDSRPDHAIVTLDITQIHEQHSLEIAILGSENGVDWSYQPLGSFSRKFYCGTYRIVVDLKAHAEVRYLLPRWKLSRWGRSNAQPLIGLSLLIEEEHALAHVGG